MGVVETGCSNPSFVFQISTLSISIFCMAEFILAIFFKFTTYKSLYFRSLFVCSFGTFLFAIGFLILFNNIAPSKWLPLIILTFGWHMMVTGFAVVMYSRIHLVCFNEKVVKATKYMIIFNYIVCHLPTTTLTFGANLIGTPWWVDSYAKYEAFQVTMFLIQELVLGALYLYYVKGAFPNDKALVFHTVYIQIVVMILDMIMVGTEYAGLYDYQITTKTLLYCLKVKLEFAVLNLLQETVKISKASKSMGSSANKKTNLNDSKKPEGVASKSMQD